MTKQLFDTDDAALTHDFESHAAWIYARRCHELLQENAVLGRALAAAQRRATRQAVIQAGRIESQQAEIVRLRAELLRRETALAIARQSARQSMAPT